MALSRGVWSSSNHLSFFFFFQAEDGIRDLIVTGVQTCALPDSFWPHSIAPGKVEAERRIPRETRDALAALGHAVAEWPEWEWRAGGGCAGEGRPGATPWAGGGPRPGAPPPAPEGPRAAPAL